jgi:hypothetical protein
MTFYSRLKYVHLAFFSKPAGERQIYRTARRSRVRAIVEIGVGDLRRAQTLIRLATSTAGDVSEIFYTGIDRFDARPAEQPQLTLKRAHQVLNATGARIKLVPGEPDQSLIRSANFMTGTDLLLIGDEFQQTSSAWFYVPRLLHDDSAVYQQTIRDDESIAYRMLSADRINELAQAHERRRAA